MFLNKALELCDTDSFLHYEGVGFADIISGCVACCLWEASPSGGAGYCMEKGSPSLPGVVRVLVGVFLSQPAAASSSPPYGIVVRSRHGGGVISGLFGSRGLLLDGNPENPSGCRAAWRELTEL
jgi:hypothetical protein